MGKGGFFPFGRGNSQGAQGPMGPQGPAGPQGPIGPQGPGGGNGYSLGLIVEMPINAQGEWFRRIPRANTRMTFNADPDTVYMSPFLSAKTFEIVKASFENIDPIALTETYTFGIYSANANLKPQTLLVEETANYANTIGQELSFASSPTFQPYTLYYLAFFTSLSLDVRATQDVDYQMTSESFEFGSSSLKGAALTNGPYSSLPASVSAADWNETAVAYSSAICFGLLLGNP